MNLYHVSCNKNLKTMVARIPRNRLDGEDSKTPRICFSTDISKALSAMPIKDRKYRYVYVPCIDTNELNIYTPNSKDVKDSKYTDEKWILNKTIQVKCVGKIQVEWIRGIRKRNGVVVNEYEYQWIENFNN